MKKIALFPGSFDPFTIGHESIVNRAKDLFDEIIIGIGYNSAKQGFFPVDKRQQMIEAVFASDSKIKVHRFEGLTIDYCKTIHANYILRGLRTAADFEYERAIGQMNKILLPELETIFLLTFPEHSMVSSTIVREVLKYHGDVSKFVPAAMIPLISEK